MKMPAQSKVESALRAQSQDRQAIEALKAAGEPFTVPGFCRELAAILRQKTLVMRT